MNKTILYDYYRSTACYRVRIVLALKNIDYQKETIHLIKDGGEQHTEHYQAINPQQLVPSLQIDGQVLTQSLAIIDYLENRHPQPMLLPSDPTQRARVIAVAQTIASDIHPINNLRVLQYLQQQLAVDDEQKKQWYHHWLRQGLSALEIQLAGNEPYCFGEQVTLADVCLIPQLYNAHRFEFSLNDYPTLANIEQNCLQLPAFSDTHPDK